MIAFTLATGIVLGAVFVLLWRLLGPNPGTHVSDRLPVTASPAGSLHGSMILEDDRPAWDEHQWWQEFRANHDYPAIVAAVDQQGGWASGACWDPYDSGGGREASPESPGPGFTSFVPRPGVPDVPEVVHDEYAGLPAGLPRTGCAGQPGPDAGPAADHSPPIPAAGPVPWQDELSKQDADTLRWLADYTDRWKVAA